MRQELFSSVVIKTKQASACEDNWLFKPYTLDNKMGILPRITLKELQDQGFILNQQ